MELSVRPSHRSASETRTRSPGPLQRPKPELPVGCSPKAEMAEGRFLAPGKPGPTSRFDLVGRDRSAHPKVCRIEEPRRSPRSAKSVPRRKRRVTEGLDSRWYDCSYVDRRTSPLITAWPVASHQTIWHPQAASRLGSDSEPPISTARRRRWGLRGSEERVRASPPPSCAEAQEGSGTRPELGRCLPPESGLERGGRAR